MDTVVTFTSVTISRAVTVNLGDYQSQRIEVTLTGDISESASVEIAALAVSLAVRQALASEVRPLLNALPPARRQFWEQQLDIQPDEGESEGVTLPF